MVQVQLSCSRARVLWAAEPVDWRAVKRHLYDARRHGARALVVVDGCEARGADSAAPAHGAATRAALCAPAAPPHGVAGCAAPVVAVGSAPTAAAPAAAAGWRSQGGYPMEW